MHVHGVNTDRFATILAKRWERNSDKRACELPELKSLSGYSEALYPEHQKEVCAEIERLARRVRMQQREKDRGDN